MRKKIIIIISIVLALILGRMAISNFDKNKTAKARANSAVPAVTIETVQTRNVTRQFEANARVTAKY